MSNTSFETLLVDNGRKWNRDWLTSIGSKSSLAYCWKELHKSSDIFVETSQYVTGAMIRWKSDFAKWNCRPRSKTVTFSVIQASHPLFQVDVGYDGDSYLFTISNGFVLQSIYNTCTITCTKLTPEIQSAFDHIFAKNSLEIITNGLSQQKITRKWSINFYIPKK